ncbi:Nramp family divalent metal transporter [Candidatus Dojkabacteria bacterium]|nr:Nramp family divalent metal transporter [Candidatus Dojkabacteria bacterium]
MVRNFPKLGKIGIKELGVSLVSLGMGLGSGEFILWPLLTVTYGYGILWGALLGITIQLILILEIQRYTSVKGEDFVSGVYRLNPILPMILLFASILGFGWPGFAASASELLVDIVPTLSSVSKLLPTFLLLLCSSVLLIGRNVYSKIEPIQSAIVIFSFILVMYLSVSLFNLGDLSGVLGGLGGSGNGYRFFPKDLDFSIFLGAIAYAGTGGILILSQSFYTIEERHGMTKFFPPLSLWSTISIKHEDVTPAVDDESLRNFRKLRRFQVIENIFFFWLLGIITIVLLSYLASKLLDGSSLVPNSLDFLRLESRTIGSLWGDIMGKGFLLIGFLSLLSVQIGIYDITGRVAVNVFKRYPIFNRYSNGLIYVYTIIIQLLIGSTLLLLGFTSPVWLLVTGAVINAVSMSLIAILTVILNTRMLEGRYRTPLVITGFLCLAALFYLVLFLLNIL